MKLRKRINFITVLYEKTLKESMVDKKIDEKGVSELKKIFFNYRDKMKKTMTSTPLKSKEFLVM